MALSGHSYDLYQDQFFTQVRYSIRKVLSQGKSLFFPIPPRAEELVYNFLRAHYTDPFMEWKESPEYQALSKLGFALESINPVIDDCYHRIIRGK
jgi:hypothetical protein